MTTEELLLEDEERLNETLQWLYGSRRQALGTSEYEKLNDAIHRIQTELKAVQRKLSAYRGV